MFRRVCVCFVILCVINTDRNAVFGLYTLWSTWRGLCHTTAVAAQRYKYQLSFFFSFLSQVQRKAHWEKITAIQFRCSHLHKDLEINTWYYHCSLSQCLESESPRHSPEAAAPAPSWPQQGKITFQDVEMRYRDDLPLVLKNLSFTIMPEETIGIVGRTGSGISDPFCSPASSNSSLSSYHCSNLYTHLFTRYLSACVCRKIVPCCSSVQTRGADSRLCCNWWDQYCTDWSGWPAEKTSHHSSRACALHWHRQVIKRGELMHCSGYIQW